jgi:hypothetical protein
MPLLLVHQLAIQSSYLDNVEGEADPEHFDTVQWWITPEAAWRIRTFAVDGDVHLHHVAGPVDAAVLRESTQRNYDEVTARVFEVDVPDLQDAQAVATAMAPFGGAEALEVDRNGARFAFWNPLQVRFETRSEPE